MGKLTSIVLCIVILSSFASALDVRTGSETQPLCPRDTALFTDFVTNTAADAREYNVNTQGAADVWATSVPTGFILSPGEQRTVYTYVTPGKNAAPGTYSLDVIVSGQGETSTVSHPVTVKDCFGASLQSITSSGSACPFETAKYEFTLTNDGEYEDTFELSVQGQIKDQVSLSDSVVKLRKGKNKKIFAYVTAPNKAGSFEFTLTARGKNTAESFNALLNVRPCFDFSVEVDKSELNFCEHTVVQVPVRIRNQGTAVNEFDVLLDGPNWARLDKNFVKLGKSQSELVTMVAAPAYGIDGVFDVKLEIVPKNGDLKAVHDFNVNVRKCNAVAADIVEESARICSGSNMQHEVVIKNTGETTKEFRTELESPGWISFNEISPSFTLRPNEIKKLFLKSTPGLDVPAGNYKVKVKAVSTDESSVSTFSEDVFNIEAVSVEACYNPSLELETENVAVFEDATSTVPITVRNNGITKGDFNLVVSGTASNFVQLTPSVVSVNPGKSEAVYLYIAPAAQTSLGNYDAVISVRLTDSDFLDSTKINIAVTDNQEDVDVSGQVVEKESPNKILKHWEKVKIWKWHFLSLVLVLILIIVLAGFRKSLAEFFYEK